MRNTFLNCLQIPSTDLKPRVRRQLNADCWGVQPCPSMPHGCAHHKSPRMSIAHHKQGGVNTKVEAANAKKAASKAAKDAAKSAVAVAEAAYWDKGEDTRSERKRQEEERKRAELDAKKAE
ncbi:hypothetical protein PsorP6_011378 [Peronosclerospora sorghi]|uniref:Uncharacterized protein n=1 Tax=Peronosclerospora sorghi TaxID=230839 RepID=A0ACC0WJI1_9STRA|nr:hypothetical protein PsorP6_011378 [Peronosclerospora sorghi]